MIKEKLNISGEYFFMLDGKLIRHVPNQLIKDQIHHMKNLLIGYTPANLHISHCALGTGTTAATENDSTLETEGARTAYTNLYGQGNQIISEFTFTGSEANGTWSEVGIYCGTDVTTSSPDTGRLYSRALIDPVIVKTSGKELTIRHVFTWNY